MDWKRTLKKTSQLLLKHLKGYHKSVIKLISYKIKGEEAKLRRRVDFLDNFCLPNQLVLNLQAYWGD